MTHDFADLFVSMIGAFSASVVAKVGVVLWRCGQITSSSMELESRTSTSPGILKPQSRMTRSYFARGIAYQIEATGLRKVFLG